MAVWVGCVKFDHMIYLRILPLQSQQHVTTNNLSNDIPDMLLKVMLNIQTPWKLKKKRIEINMKK